MLKQQNNKYATCSALSSSSFLLTDNGIIRLSTLVDGMNEGDIRISTINLINRDGIVFPSNKVQCFGVRSTYRVDLENGISIKTTYNQRLKCLDKKGNIVWTSIENLHPHDYVIVVLNDNYDGFGLYDECDELAECTQRDFKHIPSHVLQGKERFVRLFCEMVLSSYRRPYSDNIPRTKIRLHPDNHLSLEHEAISLSMARELQLLLLSCYGIMSKVIRHDGDRGTLVLENENLHKLSDLTDIVYLLSDYKECCDMEPDNITALLELFPYEPVKHLVPVEVADIKSVKKEPVYNFLVEPHTNFIANGMINSAATTI